MYLSPLDVSQSSLSLCLIQMFMFSLLTLLKYYFNMKLQSLLVTSLFVFINANDDIFKLAIDEYHLKVKFNDSGVSPKEDVLFYLYTRINADTPQQLWVDDQRSIDQSAFNASQPTKFMTHGWRNSHQGRNCKTVRNAFLARDDYNVIIVDWSNIAKLNYPESVERVKAVGAHIAKMIDFLKSLGNDPNNMSLVGHSLGAHVMGLAGNQATNKVGHVVGLDPSRPAFELVGPDKRISIEDGRLVEIIHTNDGYYGLPEAVGHLDFYVNGGGRTQPGCREDPDCAHNRAYILYAEAILKSDSLFGARCKSYAEFQRAECENVTVAFPTYSGDESKPKGSFYLRTRSNPPYGLGRDGTKPVKM